MEMKHTCKLCNRHFSNGRALGGHMRSHVISAGVGGAASTASVSTSSADEPRPQPQTQTATPASYVLRENPKRSIKLSDPEYFSSLFVATADYVESSIVQDQQSDIESSPRASTHAGGGGATARRQRSKRRRRSSPPPPLDFELASSVSDATTEEDVAFSLIMLSRDTWKPQPDPEPISNSNPQPDNGSNKARTRFECNACKKVFRSFQALGGHRAGFKNGKVRCVGLSGEKPRTVRNGFESDSLINDNVDGSTSGLHPCPFCPKVFSSGQALGGHKKSHLKSFQGNGNGNSSDVIVNSVPASSSSSPVGFIDLNLPAPVDDEFEMSAVYDAEYDQIKIA